MIWFLLCVTQEPSQWSDIRGTSRLTGRCHGENCGGERPVSTTSGGDWVEVSGGTYQFVRGGLPTLNLVWVGERQKSEVQAPCPQTFLKQFYQACLNVLPQICDSCEQTKFVLTFLPDQTFVNVQRREISFGGGGVEASNVIAKNSFSDLVDLFKLGVSLFSAGVLLQVRVSRRGRGRGRTLRGSRARQIEHAPSALRHVPRSRVAFQNLRVTPKTRNL